LQDHKRAVIVGVQTFGKASVQSVVPLDEKTAMKFTTARYMSPLGRMIDGVGLKPDEWVERRPEDSMDPQIIRALTLLIEPQNKNTISPKKTKGKP
jgi:carboxyl-terminal processing protease